MRANSFLNQEIKLLNMLKQVIEVIELLDSPQASGDKVKTLLEERGLKVLTRSIFQNGGCAVYFDTGKVGGILLELIQWPSAMV